MLGRPFEEAARVAVAHDLAVGDREHAVGGRQAALEALLDQHNGGVTLLVEAAQLPDQLVARDRVQLRGGLVEQHQLRAGGERAGEGHPLQLPARELGGGTVEQVRDAEGERGFLHRARHGCGPQAAVLQCEGDLRAHRGHHDLRLRIREQRPGVGPDLGRCVLAGVEAGRQHGPPEGPAVEVRTSPQAARSSVDFPEPESPATTQNSPGSIDRLTSRRAGAGASG